MGVRLLRRTKFLKGSKKNEKANFEIILPCSPTKPVKKLGNYGYSEEAEAVVHGDLVRAPPVPFSGTSRWAFCFFGVFVGFDMIYAQVVIPQVGVDALLRTR